MLQTNISMFGKWMIVFLTCVCTAQCAPHHIAFEDDNNLTITQQQHDGERFDANTLSEEDRSLLRYFDGGSREFLF